MGTRNAISMVHLLRLQEFHLALEMLLSNALWQPADHPSDLVFIALHTRLSGDQGCELIGGFQHCRPEEEKQLLPLPACKE